MKEFRKGNNIIESAETKEETVILLGATGSGKSTISQIMGKKENLISCIKGD